MTYTRQANEVILQMTVVDYERLLMMLGFAIGAATRDGPVRWDWVQFVNGMNRTNPEFTPYELPKTPLKGPISAP